MCQQQICLSKGLSKVHTQITQRAFMGGKAINMPHMKLPLLIQIRCTMTTMMMIMQDNDDPDNDATAQLHILSWLFGQSVNI